MLEKTYADVHVVLLIKYGLKQETNKQTNKQQQQQKLGDVLLWNLHPNKAKLACSKLQTVARKIKVNSFFTTG